MQQVQLKVLNVKCSGCVANIQNGLQELPGVEEVKVELTGEVSITGAELDPVNIKSKLDELGYPVAE